MKKNTYVRNRRQEPLNSEVKQPTSKELEDIATLACQFYQQNKIKNAAAAKERSIRSRLLSLCVEAGVKSQEVTCVSEDGSKLVLSVTVARGQKSVIDLDTLKRLIPAEQYEKCLSATQTRVEEVAGKTIALAARRVVSTEMNVSVSTKK